MSVERTIVGVEAVPRASEVATCIGCQERVRRRVNGTWTDCSCMREAIRKGADDARRWIDGHFPGRGMK